MRAQSPCFFRIFANANLGTQYDYTAFTGEWLPSKGTGQSPVLPEINCATGNVILKSPMIKTQEQIGDWELGFVYNAQNASPWSLNVPAIASISAEQLTFTESDGSLVIYTYDPIDGAYVAPSGSQSKSRITKLSDNSFLQLDPKTGKRTVYDEAGKITAVYDARGLSMQYAYNEQGRLETITSAAGVYAIQYNGLETTLTFVATGETKTESLGIWTFDAHNRLQSAVIPGNNDYAIHYAYNGNSNQLTSITQTDGTSVNLTYTSHYPAKIKTVQQGSKGRCYTFDYTADITTITDALGFQTNITLDESSRVLEFEQSCGDVNSKVTTLTSSCNYDDNGNCTAFIKPNHGKTQYQFNSQGLITQKTNPDNQITAYDYDPKTFSRIIKRTLICNNNDIESWAVTRYVYANTIRPSDGLPLRTLAFTVSPEGCVTQYDYDASGLLQSQRTYLKNTYPVKGMDEKTTLSYADMQAWALVQPKDAITLTTFSENNRGQRTQIQRFSQINQDGTGKESLDASNDQYRHHTRWGGIQTHKQKMDVDSNGNEVLATSQQSFDQLHRLRVHQNALSELRSIIYNDASAYRIITEPNGRTEKQTWNDAGQITTTTTAINHCAITRTQSHYYDAAGNVTAIQHIDGCIAYQLFDSMNRLRFKVSPEGCVTEHCYDDVNRYQRVTQYNNKVSTNSFSVQTPPIFDLLNNPAYLTRDRAADVTTYQVFDLSHRLQFEIDGRGAVIEHKYDYHNREIQKIAYALPLSDNELITLKQGAFTRTPGENDSVNVTFYDNDNHIIATQDPAGYITTYQRNPAGFLNVKYTFATPVPIILNNSLSLPPTSTDDYAQYFYTDAKGQTTLIVDGTAVAHYATQHAFYPTGKIQTETHFANQAPVTPSVISDPATLIPTQNSEDQTTRNEYDLLERLTRQHLPQMRLKENTFDIMGNTTTQSIGDDPDQLPQNAPITTQTTAKQFDDWGQLTAQASPSLYAKILANPEDSQQIWETQSERYIHDDQTGLLIAKKEQVADDGDINNPATTLYYSDKDRRIVLTVGPDGRASETQWHTVFDKPLRKTRYATAMDTADLTGGFIDPSIEALLIKKPLLDISEQFSYDGCGDEVNHVDPDGYVTQTQWNMFGQWAVQNRCVNSTTPSLTVARTFDLRRSLVTETQSAGGKSIKTVNKTYANLHGLCDTSADGNGATTAFTYEPRGVLLTSTDPLNRVTTFAHDAFERQTLRLTSGLGIQTLYSQSARSLTTNHVSASTSSLTVHSSTVDTHDAFGNTLLHQDAKGSITQFSYDLENYWCVKTDALNNTYNQSHDVRGLLCSEGYMHNSGLFSTNTGYLYSLNRECTTQIQDTNDLKLTTHYAWNTLSQRYQTTTPSGNVQSTVFNKRSLATEHHKIIDEQTSVITAQSYDAKQKSTALSHYTSTQSHTYQEQMVFDDFGRDYQRIVNPNNLKLTHTKTLDNVNRVIATTDPKGQTTFIVRDKVGNIRFEINAKGGVTEHCYNEHNNVIFTAQYVTPVDLTEIAIGVSEEKLITLLNPTDYDRHTLYFYDQCNNERFRVNRAGAVVESRYNANCEKIATIQYDARIPTTVDKSTLTTDLLITQCAQNRNTAKDKATYRVLDALGQEVFVITADGTITQKMYHSTLHKVNGEINYANRVADPESLSQLSIAQITAQLNPSDDDRKTYWITDALDRLQFHVSPSGAVVRYDYDGNTNNRTKITEFAQAITTTRYDALLTQLNALVPDPATDNIETCVYDKAQRIITRTNALGKSESFTYDGASRKSSHTTFSGHQWTYDYDGASRLWKEGSPQTTVYAATLADPANAAAGIKITPTCTSVQKKMDYDANDNVTGITSGVDLSDAHIVNFAYNELNLKNQDTWSNVPVDDPTKPTSLLVRPETNQSVSKSILHGAHGAKLITFDEANNPTFYVYNAEGQLHYKINAQGFVTEYQRNAFGECNCFISYANKLTITLSQYITANPLLTSDIVTANIAAIKDPARDRSYHQTLDQNGRVIQIQRDAVVCYTPNADPAIAPTVTVQSPTKQMTYDAFGQTITVNDNARQTLIWYDTLGNEIATVDANGKVILKTYDAFSRQTEEYRYATAMVPPAAGISYAELKSLLPAKDATKDHHTLTPRDQIGRIKGIYHVGMTTQSIVAGQTFADNPVATIGVSYTYTDDNKIKSIAYPDGQVKINYYDERRFLVATAEVARTQVAPDGTQKIIRPITYYYVSIHGERVGTFKPESGSDANLDPASEIIPVPLQSSDQDQYHRLLRDARGNVLLKQNADGNTHQMTHTLTGKISRQYKSTTNAAPTAANPAQRITHIDETRKTYDTLDNVTLIGVYRDGEIKSQITYQHDAFNVIAEGPADGTFPTQHKFDQVGRKWYSTDSKGGAVLFGHNATGEQTVEVESTTRTIDLSITVYSDLPALFQEKRDDVSNYEFTETQRDPGGRPNGFVEPGYAENDTIVRPRFQLTLDNFDKKIQTVTPAGDATQFERNKFGKITKQTDPAVEVMDEAENKSTQSAVTTLGYDNLGKKIGVTDANGHTELLKRDEASQVLSHIAADGTPYFTNTLNTFGCAIKVTSASGNTWEKVFNGASKVIQITMPTGDVYHYTLNENNFLIEETPPVGSVTGITRYAQGVFGDMSAHYLPMGEAHFYDHDRHHGILSHRAVNSDASQAYAVTYQRDFWGKEIGKTDGSGSTYQTQYYNNGVLYQQLGLTVTGHGEMAVFDSTTNTFTQNTATMPLKNLTYHYLTRRRLSSIVDANTVKPQTLAKLFDINRNPISVVEKNAAGNLLRNTAMTFNARNWPVTHTDINFSMNYYYDLVSNRRAMLATCHGITHNGYWTYDVADRVLVNDGQLINGVIQSVFSGNFGYYAPSQGNTFGYANGLRVSQALLISNAFGQYADTNPTSVILSYNRNEMLSTVSTLPPVPLEQNAIPLTVWFNTTNPWVSTSQAATIYWYPTNQNESWPNNNLATTAMSACGKTINGVVTCNPASNGASADFYGEFINLFCNAVVTINVNDQVYQGSVITFFMGDSSAQNFYFPENIQYTPDGIFQSARMNCFSDPSRWVITSQPKYNGNGYTINCSSQTLDGNLQASYSLFNINGYPSKSSTAWQSFRSATPVTDTTTNTFMPLDALVIASTVATRTDQYGSNTITSLRHYDANTGLGSVTNVSNPYNSSDQSPHTIFLDNSLDGRVLNESVVAFDGSGNVTSNIPTHFYHDTGGNVVAEYGTIVNSANQTQVVLELTADPVQSLNVSDLSNIPSTIIQPGDNWETISYRLFRDPNYRSILRAYSGVHLAPGQVINGRQVINAYNKARDYAPYQRLMDVVYNSMNPALKTPQPPPPHHESFWDEIIEAVVAIVVMVAVPEAAGIVFGTLKAVETAIVFTVAGAMSDAAAQGVAIAFDDQHGFSLKEMLENAVASGATAGIGKALGIDTLLKADTTLKYTEAFAEYLGIGLTVQLAQMAAGLRDKLDIKSIMEQAAAQVISAKINNDIPKHAPSAVVHGLDEVANTTVGAAFGEQPDLTALAGNYLGDEAADGADYLGKRIKSQHSGSSIHKTSTPTQASDKDQAPQTAAHFNPDFSSSDADDGIGDLYTEYKNGLSGDISVMAQSDYASARSADQREAQEHRATHLQRRAARVSSSVGFFQRTMNHFINAADDVGAYAVGVGKFAYDLIDGFGYAQNHPIQMMLMSCINNESNAQFVHALLNSSTRHQAMTQFNDAIDTSLKNNWREISVGGISGFEKAGEDSLSAGLFFTPAKFTFFGDAAKDIQFYNDDAIKSTGKYGVQYRAERMLETNVGYNITPEEVFSKYSQIGLNGTYITDYRAIAEILGPVRANEKFDVGFFSAKNQISYFKTLRLERALGLKIGSLSGDGFRFTRVREITELHPRCPLVGNKYFKDPGAGLPSGGPELVIDSIPTSQWPRIR